MAQKSTISLPCNSCGQKITMTIPIPQAPGMYNYRCPKCQGVMSANFSQELIDRMVKSAEQQSQPKPKPEPQPQPQPNPDEPKPVSPTKPGGKNKTMTIDGIDWVINEYRGELVQITGWWRKNKRFELRNGDNKIGRANSDVNFPQDKAMSRQSVNINVTQGDLGYVFRFKVLNAANPVLHNEMEMPIGTEIALNYGDSIKLGNTKFIFEKEK